MSTYAGNLKKGEFIIHQSEIWQIQKSEFYSPGKGSALMRTKIKNVKSGKNIDYTYKSNESVETVDVNSIEMQYLYKDQEFAYFMDEQSYNQYQVPLSVVGRAIEFFKEGEKMFVYIHDDQPLSVRAPLSVTLKIVQTEDAVKGDTVSGAKKEAELETGVKVMVPLFIKVGEKISVNPETGQYTGRQ
ncbi:elongation factor P [Candidatus Roizmanbacteria bacterium RIFCSPLOWO2_01_FULL_38_12]|uniref:Elongation factor P n=1 Tax=Candidatus Roizmanbacteria bacterium RIFCSPLOWO2_01_FULL_38_12 TaxID=1802061 RepID=A0A1F7IXV1_9BACT|nr:MAG: elongation factor P [Candidatus Roizmanbacteria bacterium RIFCSPHIGHO2_01_FULL_38_15]OGK36020.1 MAG: elongation factor P [Candidatus Roizmanbacteria bacterium RIFCSPHIGHO2_12_FULL_38_13]OGK48200.1 MAG: elongation factor P [Candidatus Roizmanbacteria bacterium RIFCSPLOWO2_01_FULL_38_12]